MEIFLINHTTPQVPQGLCYGQLDLEPSDSFYTEVERLESLLPDTEPDICYSSPLSLCRKLSGNLCPEQTVHYDDRLLDLNYGQWEGQYWDHIDPMELHQWSQQFTHVAPPRGESYNDLFQRCITFWEKLMEQPIRQAYIVTHGEVIRVLLVHILGMPLQNIFRLQVDYNSVSMIHFTGNQLQIGYINRR